MAEKPRPTYYLYGTVLASDFPFVTPIWPADSQPNLTFTVRDQPLRGIDWEQAEPAYRSLDRVADGENFLVLYQVDGATIIRMAEGVDFDVGAKEIVAYRSQSVSDRFIDRHFLGNAMSIWLEHAGMPVIHASGIVVDDAAIGFMSHSGAGKSCLAAEFVAAGYPLLSDDTLALEITGSSVIAKPGYPQLRMWPQEAIHFLGHYRDLPIVASDSPKRRVPLATADFGAFCPHPQPLVRVYLPQRRDPAEVTDVEISPLPLRDAFFMLIRTGYLTREAEALNLQSRRLDVFADLARRVPVRRLIYPSGLDKLPHVRDAVLADLASL
jgi:hypothetical protein